MLAELGRTLIVDAVFDKFAAWHETISVLFEVDGSDIPSGQGTGNYCSSPKGTFLYWYCT